MKTLILFLALCGIASAQQQAPPPGSYYQPAVLYVPTWHSGPFQIIWWRTWAAYPQPAPQPQYVQPQPQLPPPQQ